MALNMRSDNGIYEETGILRFNGFYCCFRLDDKGNEVNFILKFFPDYSVTEAEFIIDRENGIYFPKRSALSPSAHHIYSGSYQLMGQSLSFRTRRIFNSFTYSGIANGESLSLKRVFNKGYKDFGTMRYKFYTYYDIEHNIV